MGKKNKKQVKLVAPAPGVGDEFFEFEGANIHPSAENPKAPKVISKKSSRKPSPYTKREVILPTNDAATSGDTYETGDITRDTLRERARRTSVPGSILEDALRRKHGIHRAEPEKEGVFTKIANRLRTKNVSGVKIVGAKDIIVTKLTQEQLEGKGDGNEAAIAENLAMMEEMDDDDLGIL